MNETRGIWRGKRLNDGEWVQGLLAYRDFFNNSASLYQEAEYNGIWVDPSTLGECTGLRDKNGKLIFEKDIIKSIWGDVGIIKFGEYRQPINEDDCSKHIGYFVEWLKAKNIRVDLGYWAFGLSEVIGNAFDNPDLLKGKNDVSQED